MWQNENLLSSKFARLITSALLFTLDASQAGSFSNCGPFLIESSLCLRNFHCFRFGNRFVHHVVVRPGNATSFRDVVLVSLLLSVSQFQPVEHHRCLCPRHTPIPTSGRSGSAGLRRAQVVARTLLHRKGWSIASRIQRMLAWSGAEKNAVRMKDEEPREKEKLSSDAELVLRVISCLAAAVRCSRPVP